MYMYIVVLHLSFLVAKRQSTAAPQGPACLRFSFNFSISPVSQNSFMYFPDFAPMLATLVFPLVKDIALSAVISTSIPLIALAALVKEAPAFEFPTNLFNNQSFIRQTISKSQETLKKKYSRLKYNCANS